MKQMRVSFDARDSGAYVGGKIVESIECVRRFESRLGCNLGAQRIIRERQHPTIGMVNQNNLIRAKQAGLGEFVNGVGILRALCSVVCCCRLIR
jgi:hypothetical protein